MVFKILPFSKACFLTCVPWSWLWRQHRLLTVPVKVETVEMLSGETPDFMHPLQWPPNSPDLKPVDYAMRQAAGAGTARIRDVDHLVERLVEEWSRFDHEIISAVVTQWQARLHACVCESGKRTLHILWHLMNDHTASCFIGDNFNQRCKNVFYVFYLCHVFLRFLTFFISTTFFITKKLWSYFYILHIFFHLILWIFI